MTPKQILIEETGRISFLLPFPPPECPNFTCAMQLKLDVVLISRICNDCTPVVGVFSVILSSYWSFLLLCSFNLHSYFLVLFFPFLPNVGIYLAVLPGHLRRAKSAVRVGSLLSVLLLLLQRPLEMGGVTAQTSCSVTAFLGTCWDLHELCDEGDAVWVGPGGCACCSPHKLKFGRGSGTWMALL